MCLASEEQWQLRHAPYQRKGSFLVDSDQEPFPVTFSGRERPTKWVHFSAQNVSNIETCPGEIVSTNRPR